MDAHRFDTLTRTMAATGSRRWALRGLAGTAAASALALVGVRGAGAQTTCTLKKNGERCASGDQCCSGLCKKNRRTGKKECRRAPGQGTCTVEQNVCAGTGGSCNGADCQCFVTAAGRSLCGDPTAGIDSVTACDECPNGKVCVRGGGSDCAGVAFACVKPCAPPA